ncbi:hypothetical protein ACFCX4_33900 [Kitasatospora sp. NPDC056327]|uniref:hypothetical protein n=1 Tax=Kitasatospora sp. NPDC056327 TaxID=3345785 RepID=UPI0035D54479
MLTAGVAFALTAAGTVVAGLRAHRRRFLSATRWFAVALLPAGLYLTGLFPVARTIGDELADWAAALVLDPRVWTGIALLGVSAGLLLTTRWLSRRGAAAEGQEARPAAAGPAPARPAVAPAAGVPAAPASPRRAAAKAERAGRAERPAKASPPGAAEQGKDDDGLGDFADIEEILRRRGI